MSQTPPKTELTEAGAVKVLGALAQASRLRVYRLLVERGPEGCAVGEIAETLAMANATLSFHLKELTHAGLLVSRQAGRFIYYAPDFAVMNGLIGFLTENCCQGKACDLDADGQCVPTSAKTPGRKRTEPA